MALPKDAIPLNQQQSNLPADAIPLGNSQATPQQYATQAAQMPIGQQAINANQIAAQPNYTPRMMGVDPNMNPALTQQQAEAGALGKLQPEQTQSLGSKAGEEVLSGATSIAKDAELGDLLTSAMRMRNENYAIASRAGLAGGQLNVKAGELLGQKPLIKGTENMYDPDAIKAASDFDAAGNGLLSQGQQLFAGQIGTGNASTRIITTVLHLLGGEFGDRTDSVPSLMGRQQGSQQTIYLIQKYGQNYLSKLSSMGVTPSNIDNLPQTAIDKIANDWAGNLQSYKLTPEDRSIIKARTDYVNEPLQELMDAKNGKSVDYKDALAGVK